MTDTEDQLHLLKKHCSLILESGNALIDIEFEVQKKLLLQITWFSFLSLIVHLFIPGFRYDSPVKNCTLNVNVSILFTLLSELNVKSKKIS